MADDTYLSSRLLSPLHASAAMRTILSDRARLQRMLDFEAALARAEAALGVIPASSAVEIGDACRAEQFSISALADAAIPAGHIAIAMVNALTVEVARFNNKAAGFVHWGATSQDVVDTALMLELREAIDALVLDLDVAIKGFTTLAGRHRRTLAVARTLMQHALPMPFGLKLAGYAAALARSRERLMRLRRETLALQFGGAAGTLAALGDQGLGVAERMAALLDLPNPDAPWHSHRDRLADVATAFAILAGTCGKIAGDIALMMQTEVGEVSEPERFGLGGSSTMPHKRNPTGVAPALAAATMAPNLAATILAAQVQEYERGVGGWQTEWHTFPALALIVSGALEAVVQIAEGLEIDVERLRTNLELSGNHIMAEAVSYALAEKIGRQDAYRLVRELSLQAQNAKQPLREVLINDMRVKAHLTSIEIEKLLTPITYQGSAQSFIERLIVSTQSRAPRRAESWASETKLPTAPQLRSADVATLRGEMPKFAPLAPPPEVMQILSPAASATPAAATSTAHRHTLDQLDAMAASSPDEHLRYQSAAEDPMPAPITEEETPSEDTGPETEPGVIAAEPEPTPPVDEDTPGAFMEILSRADAEATSDTEDKPKPS